MRRRLRRLAVLAALGLAAPGQEPLAAKLPDWARDIAESASSVPEGIAEHDHRVLLYEMRYEVRPDGTLRQRKRIAKQALQAGARGVAVDALVIGGTAKSTAARAWHLPPDARAKKSWMPPVEVNVGGGFVSDAKARGMWVEGVRKGSLAFFEFEAVDKPYFLSLLHGFYDEVPTDLARFELQVPAGWGVRAEWLRGGGPPPVVSGDVRVWELRDLPVIEPEELSPAPDELAPLLAVHLDPPETATTIPAIFRDWSAASVWYDGLIAGRHEADPRIEEAARKAYQGAGDGLFDRVLAAGRFVRDKIRYVAVEIGIGGWQPRPASDTLANLYGDCKDKGTLFRSMLTTGGITSYPVLINLGRRGVISEALPVLAFNHFVVAIPLQDGAEVPPAFAPALVDGGELGRLLIVDTTDEFTSIGSLSDALAGQFGLVVAGGRGRLIRLPDGDPRAHRLERRLELEVRPDRSVTVIRRSTYSGAFAWSARGTHAGSSEDRRKSVERRVRQLWPDAALQEYAAETETREGTFVETVAIKLPPSPERAPRSHEPVFPGAADDVTRVPLGKRKLPVQYGHPMTVRYEVVYKGLPGGTQPPAPQAVEGEGWSVRSEYATSEQGLTARWEATLARPRFEPGDFAELRRFWSALASTAGWTIDLSAATSTAP